MNYDATIHDLEQKRDFYASAVVALKKIAAHENATATTTTSAKPRKKNTISPEALERMREGQRKRWAEFRAKKAASANGNEAAHVAESEMAHA